MNLVVGTWYFVMFHFFEFNSSDLRPNNVTIQIQLFRHLFSFIWKWIKTQKIPPKNQNLFAVRTHESFIGTEIRENCRREKASK